MVISRIVCEYVQEDGLMNHHLMKNEGKGRKTPFFEARNQKEPWFDRGS